MVQNSCSNQALKQAKSYSKQVRIELEACSKHTQYFAKGNPVLGINAAGCGNKLLGISEHFSYSTSTIISLKVSSDCVV